MRCRISCSANRSTSRSSHDRSLSAGHSSPSHHTVDDPSFIPTLSICQNHHLCGGSMRFDSILLTILLLVGVCSTVQSQWVQTNGPYGGDGLGIAWTPNGADLPPVRSL